MFDTNGKGQVFLYILPKHVVELHHTKGKGQVENNFFFMRRINSIMCWNFFFIYDWNMLWNPVTQKERVNLKINFFSWDESIVSCDENFFYIYDWNMFDTNGKGQLENKFFFLHDRHNDENNFFYIYDWNKMWSSVTQKERVNLRINFFFIYDWNMLWTLMTQMQKVKLKIIFFSSWQTQWWNFFYIYYQNMLWNSITQMERVKLRINFFFIYDWNMFDTKGKSQIFFIYMTETCCGAPSHKRKRSTWE